MGRADGPVHDDACGFAPSHFVAYVQMIVAYVHDAGPAVI
jgi:hypothetical protein